MTPSHRHIETGGLYTEMSRGLIERDLTPAVIYRGEDGQLWVRPASEFDDPTRFERLGDVARMTDRPIIFGAPMMCALLEGRKTMTRRILKPQPVLHTGWEEWGVGIEFGCLRVGRVITNQRVPYAVGDRLWVRETWNTASCAKGLVAYRADGEAPDYLKVKWRSPLHMPRRLSRLTLVVTSVKIERLQSISRDDVIAEGAVRYGHFPSEYFAPHVFRDLWNSIHGDQAWQANPWVAAISFDVHHHNIDKGSA